MPDLEILLLVIVFASGHLLAPLAWRYRQHAHRLVTSFAGGLAMAYVCLHLIPEIDSASHVLGERVYFLIMAGFAAYYGLEILVHRRVSSGEARLDDHTLNVSLVALYNFLLVFTLAHQVPATPFLTLGFAVMIGLHLLMTDFGLMELFDDAFRKKGRYILVGAVLLGWVLTFAGEPEGHWVDTLSALLAGSMMYKVFRNELPEFRQAHYGAFVVGLVLFFVLHTVLGVG
jgi:zinc transporter ZupT